MLSKLLQTLRKRLWGHAAIDPASTVADSSSLPIDMEARIQEIRGFIASGQLKDAETRCQSILQAGLNAHAFQLLGYVAQQTGRYELAVEKCIAANDSGLNDWSNYLVLGLSLRSLGRHAEAVAALTTAYQLSPFSIDAALLLLEETVVVAGFDSATELYRVMASQITDATFTRAWKKLSFEKGDVLAPPPDGCVGCDQMTARSWARDRGLPVTNVEGVDDIPVESPPVINACSVSYKTTIYSNDPYVLELKGATIFSKSNIILTSDGVALDETGAHAHYGQFVSHRSDNAVIGQRGGRLLIDTNSFEIRTLEVGIMLSGALSGAFGHWVPEYLPKLQFYEHHPEFRQLPIIVDEEMPQSHYDYLNCIAKNPLIKIPTNVGFRCVRLIYAPPATFFPAHLFQNEIPVHEVGPVSPRSYRYLKSRVEATLGTRKPGGGKYFLSRRNMTWRRLSNDAEVSKYLEAKGYETVQIESLSFVEQVRMFQNATHIVASNGSSLQNIIFSDPSVRLLVLSQSNLVNWGAFYAQTGELGYHSRFVCGESIGDPSQKHADYFVPLSALEAAVED